jgi:ADP-heptose:LPS heptosyltransferase
VTPTVLVLRALGIGDLLTAVPALRALRAAYPDHRIVLATPSWLGDLVALTGAVDELLPTPGLGPIDWTQDPPAVAVNLHGRGPQSTDALLALEPAVLIAHAQPGVPGPEWDADVHEVLRWCRLLGHFGIPADPADLSLPGPGVPSPAPGAAVVHPGAGFAARHWPPSRYAAVARRLADRGLPVVVTGSSPERSLAEDVASAAGLPSDRVLAGRLGLAELAALVSQAALTVCGDTGLAHLATAYGTPSVVLFGPVSPRLWGPPPGRPQHMALWAGLSGDTFAGRPHEGLLRVSVAEVIDAAERALRTMPVGR